MMSVRTVRPECAKLPPGGGWRSLPCEVAAVPGRAAEVKGCNRFDTVCAEPTGLVFGLIAPPQMQLHFDESLVGLGVVGWIGCDDPSERRAPPQAEQQSGAGAISLVPSRSNGAALPAFHMKGQTTRVKIKLALTTRANK